jgi:hypothetical protein
VRGRGGGKLIKSEVRTVFDFVFQVRVNFLTVGVGSAVKDEVTICMPENGGAAPLILNFDIRWRSEGSYTSRTFDLRVNIPPLTAEYQRV